MIDIEGGTKLEMYMYVGSIIYFYTSLTWITQLPKIF